MLVLDLTVFGDKQLSRGMHRFQTRFLNLTPAMLFLLNEFESMTEEQFSSEGGSGSGGWAPLAQSTIDFKRRKGYPLEILRQTLTLKDSLTKTSAPGAVRRVFPDGLDYGSNVPYGIFHQEGTEKMPRRRPVEFTDAKRRGTLKSVQAYLMTGEPRGI